MEWGKSRSKSKVKATVVDQARNDSGYKDDEALDVSKCSVMIYLKIEAC